MLIWKVMAKNYTKIWLVNELKYKFARAISADD